MFEKTSPAHDPLPFATQRRLHAALVALLFAGVFVSLAFVRGGTLAILAVLVTFVGVIPGRPTMVSVGADGFLLRWWGRERFVPMHRLRDIRPFGERLVALTFDDGRPSVRVAIPSDDDELGSRWNRDAWLDRIRTALAAYRARVPVKSLAEILGQGDRTHADWLAALRKLRAGDGGYRDHAVALEDLWKVVEDPASRADERAGAALVLRGSLDADGKERVRVAAQATAMPKLRIALDRAADGANDAEIEAALEELVVEDGPRRVWSA